jgi:hypothetical protein
MKIKLIKKLSMLEKVKTSKASRATIANSAGFSLSTLKRALRNAGRAQT